MRQLRLASLICMSLLLMIHPHVAAARAAADADYFVAVDGNDGGPGTKERPFASLAGARDAVRKLKKRNLEKEIVVLIRGGTYVLQQPTVFQLQDSGTEARRITYAAHPGERPVFSGGRAIENWSEGERIWKATLSEVKSGKWFFHQLFVDDKRQPAAREPDEGFFHVVATGPDDHTSFQFRENDLQRYSNLEDTRIVFLHDWSTSRVGIKDVDEKTHMVSFLDPIGSSGHSFFRITGFEQHPRYYVEHAPELLDSPGEWYLDRNQGVLSYVPHSDEKIGQTTIVAPVLEQLLVVRGDVEAGLHVKNLSFDGLTFSHCAAPRLPSGYAGVQAGFHEHRPTGSGPRRRDRMPAAVVLEAAAGCRFENCRVSHVGGTALSLQGNCERNRVVGNEISDAGGNGVMVGEPSTSPKQLAKNNVVANNHIHHCGTTYYGCVGIWGGITEGTTIAHNEIHDLPYTGVSIGWMWNTNPTPCNRNAVEYNHIHHVMQTLSDGGGIYTLGRQPGSVLRGNLIHDVPLNAGRAESNGLFIDEGSSQLLIEQNTIYNIERSPIRFHKATTDLVRNNVLVTPSGIPPFRFNATDPDSITFEANKTADAETWKPPQPHTTKAGLEPEYRRLLPSR
ncbi:MAG: hypothetical protein CMJ50_02680 [Planctomycetaceae bacterium]|nr:hypothetical protein [Planctomycetaceae bacterium]